MTRKIFPRTKQILLFTQQIRQMELLAGNISLPRKNETFIIKDKCFSRYNGFFDENGDHTEMYWHLLSKKLIFVPLFILFGVGICAAVTNLVPNVPKDVEKRIKRQDYLLKEYLLKERSNK